MKPIDLVSPPVREGMKGGTPRCRGWACIMIQLCIGFAVLDIPLDSLTEAFIKSGCRPEAEFLLCPFNAEAAPRLAVRFGRIPCYGAGKSGMLRYDADKFFDAYFGPRTKVNGLGGVVPFRRKDNPFCRIGSVEKLTRRRAIAPDNDFMFPLLFCIEALLDKSRNYV